jgi:hypothetical protein
MDQILEHLRRTAEEFTAEASDSRRPSWAPALLVSEEFLQLAREFGGLSTDDKPVVRLWANFADPKRVGTALRQEVGLTLPGIRCRGFALHAGTRRHGVKLFFARRGENGNWETGPTGLYQYSNPEELHLRRECRNCLHSIESYRQWIEDSAVPQPNLEAELERVRAEYAELKSQLQALEAEREARNQRRTRLLELARARVIEFGGGGDAPMMEQMTAGARVTVSCCICGAQLTDPVSVEYGIGPICRSKRAVAIKAWVASRTVELQEHRHVA